jgi:hypothetical protein
MGRPEHDAAIPIRNGMPGPGAIPSCTARRGALSYRVWAVRENREKSRKLLIQKETVCLSAFM